MFHTAELNVQVFEDLPPPELARMETVSTGFRFFLNNNYLWRRAFKKTTGVNLTEDVDAKLLYCDLHRLENYFIKFWNVDNISQYFSLILLNSSEVQRLPCYRSVGLNDDEVRQARTEHMPFLIEAASMLGLDHLTAFLIKHNHHLAPANPLFYAVYSGKSNIIKLLANANVDIHTCTLERLQPRGIQMSALHWAFICRQAESVNTLFQLGARLHDSTHIRLQLESEPGHMYLDHTYTYSALDLIDFSNTETEGVFSQSWGARQAYDFEYVPLPRDACRHLTHCKNQMLAKLRDLSAERKAAQISVFSLEDRLTFT